MMNFSFGFSGVALLPALAIVFGLGLQHGGPSGLFWGFVINFLLSTIVAFAMAELCSTFPSAGSVYHWAGQLVPHHLSPLCSYITGWVYCFGHIAGCASFAFGFAIILSSTLLASGHQEMIPANMVGVSIGVLFFWSVLNICRVDRVGLVTNFGAFFQAISTIFVVVVILIRSPMYATPDFIFTKYFSDSGNTAPPGYVLSIGLTAGMYLFCGYDGSCLMAEETQNARNSAPRGIIHTVLATGVGGGILLLSLLLCTTDISRVIETDTGCAIVELFLIAAGKEWGLVLAWLILANLFFSGITCVALTSRITYTLARDGALPFSAIFTQVHPLYESPVYAVMLVFFLNAALLLLPLDGSPGAIVFDSIIGLSTFGFQVSCGLPILFKLIFRLPDPARTAYSLGRFSNLVGGISVLWLFGTSLLLFLPLSTPVTLHTMNWLCVVVALFIGIGVAYWYLHARYHFKGPQKAHSDSTLENQRLIGQISSDELSASTLLL
jgi:amino acid transporter